MHLVYGADNGTDVVVRLVNVAGNQVSLVKVPSANWTLSTDNTTVNGTVTLGLS